MNQLYTYLLHHLGHEHMGMHRCPQGGGVVGHVGKDSVVWITSGE